MTRGRLKSCQFSVCSFQFPVSNSSAFICGFLSSRPGSYNSGMVAFRGHFDGRVIIPSGPVSLPCGRELVFHVEHGPALVSGRELLKHAGQLDQQTADEMTEAIKDCERIDDGW